MQLNTLLKSIQQHWQGHRFHVSVLYNCSSDIYANGYDLLKTRFPQVKFVQESNNISGHKLNELLLMFNLKRYIKYRYIRHPKSDFRTKLIGLLNQAEAEFVMFLTDDSQFIADVTIDSSVKDEILADPYNIQYSLRLGQNINYPGKINYVNKNLIAWNFNDPKNKRDWRYNFSVDAHIYSKKVIIDLAQRILFSNPNSYEAFTTIFCRKKGWLNRGVANIEPSILSFPINMVQDVQNNESLAVSIEQLEKWFEKGYELDYPKPERIEAFQYYPKFLILSSPSGDEQLKVEL